MGTLHDSPVSQLTRANNSLSGDLLLLSQPKASQPGKYSSVGIEYNNFVSSVISSMGNDSKLSSEFQRELSAPIYNVLSGMLSGTVTLATWKTV